MTTPAPLSDFGRVVRERRNELGYSQREFANLVGSTQGHVSGVEIGAHSPSVHLVVHWLTALGLVAEIRNPTGRKAR